MHKKLVFLAPLAVLSFACIGIFLLSQMNVTAQGNTTLPLVAQGQAVVVAASFSATPTSVPATDTPVPKPTKKPNNKKNNTIAPLFHPNVQAWKKDIKRWSNKYGIDPNIVATIMQIESCGQQYVTSHAGATSLFQVMPYHFQSNEDPYDPDTNAMRGIAYMLSSLSAHNGNVRLAFAGYNGGITGSKRPENLWAYETQRYVYWAEGIYQDARNGKKTSARLEEWLGAGGYSLCNR